MAAEDLSDGQRLASAFAVAGLRPRLDYIERHAAAVAATIGLIIFAIIDIKWMVRWHGVPSWQAWFDQGQYLKSARAFAAFDFDPAFHHYPPLYPALAAPFTSLIPNDPFVVVNAACLAGSVAMLVDAFGAAIGSRMVAGTFAVVFLLLPGIAFETFVIPWTSTPATFLVIAALFLLQRIERRGETTPWEALLFGLALGLLVLTRPLDAIAALALVPAWICCVWRVARQRRGTRWRRMLAARLIVAGLGAAIGPAMLLASNLRIYHSPFSPYIADSATLFAWDSIGQKFVSIFFDSASLFVEPAQTLMSRFPWLTLAMTATLVCLCWGPVWLRATAAIVSLQCACHLVYVDLLPNGLYRYNNFHYFRWALWLAFLMLPAAWHLLHRRFGRTTWRPATVLAAGAVGLAGLQFHTRTVATTIDRESGLVRIDLPRQRRIDYLDVAGLTASWDDTYFADPKAELDGHPFQGIDHIRALPTAAGTRFLFLHPIMGGRFELADAKWQLDARGVAAYGAYSFGFGFPKWLGRQQAPAHVGAPLRLDEPMGSYVFARGFGGFNRQGRPIEANAATLRLWLVPRSGAYRVRLGIAAEVPTRLDVRLADAAEPTVTFEADRQNRDLELSIPETAVAAAGWPTTISITLRDAPDAAQTRPCITSIEVD